LNQKSQIVIVAVIVASATIGIILMLAQMSKPSTDLTNIINQPDRTKIEQACYDKIKELYDMEPTELSMTVCVGTVMEGLRK
jgi:hypothetical protein